MVGVILLLLHMIRQQFADNTILFHLIRHLLLQTDNKMKLLGQHVSVEDEHFVDSSQPCPQSVCRLSPFSPSAPDKKVLEWKLVHLCFRHKSNGQWYETKGLLILTCSLGHLHPHKKVSQYRTWRR